MFTTIASVYLVQWLALAMLLPTVSEDDTFVRSLKVTVLYPCICIGYSVINPSFIKITFPFLHAVRWEDESFSLQLGKYMTSTWICSFFLFRIVGDALLLYAPVVCMSKREHLRDHLYQPTRGLWCQLLLQMVSTCHLSITQFAYKCCMGFFVHLSKFLFILLYTWIRKLLS